ncbi:Hypothetical predicted protein [Mytilus galloprovincialis]|uniref:Uncharacterized protein n=1 Tax=Mytilus galloprovincialis TaxID=29158 RepID=A0A8B6BFV6_MYTGA|nr:Hypothetical predicted protein [Mytilus galloprovincialis]
MAEIIVAEFNIERGTRAKILGIISRKRNTAQHTMLAQTWVTNLMAEGLPDQDQMPELEHVNDPLNQDVSPELMNYPTSSIL